MIKKRLLEVVPESKRYIMANVAVQWVSLVANIVMMTLICRLIAALWEGEETDQMVIWTVVGSAICIVVICVCSFASSRLSHLSSRTVKRRLREMIMSKLLRLGPSYRERVNSAEVVQITSEGVDQLETYFGAYLPQFFYAMLAPLTLFIFVAIFSFPSAIVLFVCVPLIPVSIVIVQKWAKKILAKYWGEYLKLGDNFLENLQGLTTMKIYSSDGYKHEEMNTAAERFRIVTMKVLTMQLNSIIIMDFIAYGGAALGLIIAALQFDAGSVTLAQALLIVLLAADFFLPMRRLGSFFHVAMNGMAASDKMFALLDLPEPEDGTGECPVSADLDIGNLSFAYGDREVIHGIDMHFASGSLTSIVGESGSGKSTVAGILTGRNRGFSGSVTVGGVELGTISESSMMENITYVGHQSYLFKGTVRENLLMGRPGASDEDLWEVLRETNLEGFLRSEQGLDTRLAEGATNLSGGQRQRLALSRALLHDSQIYIFDEATSNIDVESETVIMDRIRDLAGKKTVIMISHRLANAVGSGSIYVMDSGRITEHGTHEELLSLQGGYKRLWDAQYALETYGAGGDAQ